MKAARLTAAAALALASVYWVSAATAHDEEPQGSAEQEAASSGHGEEEHEGGEINWAYGFLGEKEGVAPDLLYRPKGMPPPFLANLANAGLLFAVLVTFGRKPIAEGLKQRKRRIVAGMEEAARMKAEAQTELAQYEDKLKRLDQEVERIKTAMRESAELERRRVLAEAKERRERMERDAHLLVEQESKAARDALVRETVMGALASAEEMLATHMTQADHDRLTGEYADSIGRAKGPTTMGARP